VVVVGEREDAFAGVCGADPEVVHPSGAAEGHLAFGVEPVVAQAEMTGLVGPAGQTPNRSGAPVPTRYTFSPVKVAVPELVSPGIANRSSSTLVWVYGTAVSASGLLHCPNV
jgi:hypothetical protein